jgi:hypothetical protein
MPAPHRFVALLSRLRFVAWAAALVACAEASTPVQPAYPTPYYGAPYAQPAGYAATPGYPLSPGYPVGPGYVAPGYPGYAPAPAPAPAPVPAPAPAPALASAPSTGPVYEPDPEGRPVEILRTDAPNIRYAAMDGATCEAELARRGAPFTRGEPTGDVVTPERLRGPLHGVTISTGAPAAVVARSPMEIFDCRLLLALDDFAAMAASRGITAMLHISAYRPKTQHGCTAKYMGLQHCGALAVDIASFKLADGTTWNVQRDFHGRVGAGTCGPSALAPAPTVASAGLHALVCDAAARGIFHVMLTPNHNAEHFNHVHVEVTPHAEWMMIH